MDDQQRSENQVHFFQRKAARRANPKLQNTKHHRIDDESWNWFRGQVHAAGGGNYQTLINAALRAHIDLQAPNDQEGLEETLRRVIREEFPSYRTGDRETP